MSYTPWEFLGFWHIPVTGNPRELRKEVGANGIITYPTEMLSMNFSNPLVMPDGSLQVDATFLVDQKTNVPLIPSALEQSNVMSVSKPGSLSLGLLFEQEIPPTNLNLLNILGDVKKIKTGEEKGNAYIELTLTEDKLYPFESSPFKHTDESKNTKQMISYLNSQHLKNYMVVLASIDGGDIAPSKPKKVDVFDSATLRVWIHKDAGDTNFNEVCDFALKHPSGKKIQVLFINYGDLPSSSEMKDSTPKRTTYFVFAKKGVTFKTEKKADRYVLYLVLNNVEKITGLTETGKQLIYTGRNLEKSISTTRPPFNPNGFFETEKNGEGHHVLFLGEAHLNSETHILTFTAGWLEVPEDHVMKGHVVCPIYFYQDTPVVTMDKPTMLFLDSPMSFKGVPRT